MCAILFSMLACIWDWQLCEMAALKVPSIVELASSRTTGHDLHVYNMQIWLANIFCLAEIQTQMR